MLLARLKTGYFMNWLDSLHVDQLIQPNHKILMGKNLNSHSGQ
jgi:hypothetical protein